jgi:hypothetical protein
MTLRRDVADQLADDLIAAVFALSAVVSLDALIPGGQSAIADAARRDAERLAASLLSGDDPLAAQTTIDLANALGWDDLDAEWWSTPLGQAVARSVGHPTAEIVSYSVAGAMLGVSKQMVAKHISQGRLDRGPDGGVTSLSVRQFLLH